MKLEKKSGKVLLTAIVLSSAMAMSSTGANATSISNFSELQNFIGSGGSGTTGSITNNITDVNAAIGAVARDGLTISGNNYYIDGANSYAGFSVTNTINSFVINNIGLKKFNTTASGGAIYARGKDNMVTEADLAIVNITNTEFNGNQANLTSGLGGAILGNRNSKLVIDGSTFDGNKAAWGGVIFTASSADDALGHSVGSIVDIKNTKFLNNEALSGGAVALMAKATLDNVLFEGNKATVDSDGAGAVFIGSVGEVTISNSKFEKNTSGTRGGAIATRDKLYGDNTNAKLDILNSTFTSNTAVTNGGAIDSYFFNSNSKDGYAYISGTKFTSNTAANGGAIYNHDTDIAAHPVKLYIENSTFTSNAASANGAAIYNEGAMTIDSSTFTSNSASISGGAIYNASNLKISNSIFNNNVSGGAYPSGGGAIYARGKDNMVTEADLAIVNITNTEFNGNQANLTDGVGGAIWGARNSKLVIDGSIFDGNKAAWGGVIFTASSADDALGHSVGSIVDIKNTKFLNNEALGAGAVALMSEATLDNVLFKGNKATAADDDGAGAAFIGAVGKVKISNSKFEGNTSEARGGAISTRNTDLGNNEDAKLDITNSEFTGNTAAANGGAIDNTLYSSIVEAAQVYIGDTSFTSNTAANGGAIYNHGEVDLGGHKANMKISDSTFTGNTASGSDTISGGAIYNAGTLTINNSTFTGNSATSTSTTSATIAGFGFGGAIHNAGTITDITGAFTNNSAISTATVPGSAGYGGAIHNVGNITNIYADFTNNSAGAGYVYAGGGGAISNTQGGAITNIVSNFTGNYGAGWGAAIFNENANITNIGSLTQNQKATFSKNVGGAITNESGAITNIYADFTENSLSNWAYGGAIQNMGSGTINYIAGNFTGNSADVGGGAIGNQATISLIENATFNENYATISDYNVYGGAIINQAKYGRTVTITTIKDSTFTNNYAKAVGTYVAQGGAINNSASATTYDSGALTSTATTGTIAGTFAENYAKSESGGAQGGAIANNAEATAIGANNATATATIGNITGTFAGNYAQSTSGTAKGGAIYNNAEKGNGGGSGTETATATITIKDSNFTNNYAQGESALGGAIYNSAIMTIEDSSFTENYVIGTTAQGGAIWNSGNITLKAKDKDVVFEDNKADKGSDIYNIGTVELIASEHKYMTFNGSIDGDLAKTSLLKISSTGTYNGDVIFNGDVSNQNITVNGGNIVLSKTGSFGDIGTLTLTDGSLSIANGVDNVLSATSIVGSTGGDAKLSFDWTDSIVAQTAMANGQTVAFGSVLADVSNIEFVSDVATTSNFNKLNFTGTAYTYTGDNKYVITQLANKDLQIAKTDLGSNESGLSKAVEQTQGVNGTASTFQTEGKYTETKDLGTVEKDLVIAGTSKNSDNEIAVDLTTGTVKGMTVGENAKVTIVNTSIKNFKSTTDGGFANNNGTIVIDGSGSDYVLNIASNKADVDNGYGGAIKNTSSHSLENTSVTYSGNTAAYGGAVANIASAAIGDSAVQIDSVVQYNSNTATFDGGAIYNYAEVVTGASPKALTASYTGTDVKFTGNKAEGGNGGAIFSNAVDPYEASSVTYTSTATVALDNADFYSNTATENGGAIYNGANSTLTFNDEGNYEFVNNTATENGGAIYNAHNYSGTYTIANAFFKGNQAVNGGAIYNDSVASLGFVDSSFIENVATTGNGGAIYTQGTSVVFAAHNDDVVIANNTANGNPEAVYFAGAGANTLELDARSGKNLGFDGAVASAGSTTVNINNNSDPTLTDFYTGTVVLGENYKSVDASGNYIATTYNVNGGTLYLANEANFSGSGDSTLTLSNATLNTQNGKVGTVALDTLTSTGGNWQFDVTNAGNDTLKVSTTPTGTVNIVGLNTAALANGQTVYNLVANGGQNVNFTLDPTLQGVVFQDEILRRTASVSGNNLMLNPIAGFGEYESYNPSVLAAPVAAQVGAYLNQINSYEMAFANMDMTMLMTKEQRQAMKFNNKYAAAGEGANLTTYSPNQVPEEDRGLWFRPYASFERVGLNNGPSVGNNTYGSFFGGDSDIIELGHGWDVIYSGYAAYNGSHQYYDGVGVYQNGGQLGATGVFYKGNFFTGLTANVGASVGSATTMYGHENFTMLATGIASKTGYNWELANGRFIIQPSWLMSYSFINTFDYTNAAGVRINSDPLNAIQLVPGLKFIGNLPHGWQPYLGVEMVWNIIDKTKFSANNVGLPEMSVDPYVQYGVGLQKRIGDYFTGYGQAMIRNGGRNGVALSFGFRWALGRNHAKSEAKKQLNKDAQISNSRTVKLNVNKG